MSAPQNPEGVAADLDPSGYNEDEDSDFEPDAAELAECAPSAPVQPVKKTAAASSKARSKTDSLWATMNGGGATKAKAASKPISWKHLQKKMKKKKKRVASWKNLLKKPKRSRSDVLAIAAKAAKTALSNESQTTVVKFAGKEMRLKQKDGSSKAKKPRVGLDSMLEAIKDPKHINTVEKSSYDWDSYKAENKLDADFDKQAQNGFVAKKEFLTRVDWRKFDSEKGVRATERTKRDAQKK